jgi:hypothetical protein
MKEDLHKKIDEVLNSLDGMQRAEASPFLYSKIRNRMEMARQVVPQPMALRLAIALALVILLNLVTILQFNSGSKKADAGVESVANEYSISLPQTY